MKLERLKRNKLKKYAGIVLVFIAVIVTVLQLTSRAKYRTTQSIELARGTINYQVPDFNLMAVYLEKDGGYQLADNIPTNGYTLNKERTYCKVNENYNLPITIEYNNGSINIFNLTQKGTKCYLYFDKQVYAKDQILANKTISTKEDFSTTLKADTTGTMYSAEDDYGTSYYFAGNPTDNWVKFAGFYWRIIRINGDGTIRMIYQGTAANTTGTSTQATKSAFNSSYNDNMYVGYQYTSGSVHGNGTNSTIKGVLDSWYSSNLSSYASKIATGGGASFCNDRQPSTDSSSLNGSGGTGTTQTYYAAYNRLVTNKVPTFKCADTGDRFATSVGLITADEVAYAGGVYNTNNSGYYLYTGQYYWTMSPDFFNGSYAFVFHVTSSGNLHASNVSSGIGVRPVINLKADTIFADGGKGTSSNPYVLTN